MKHISLAVIALAMLGIAACTTTDDRPMTDRDIQAAVMSAFADTTGLDASRITVGVENAVVTLDGEVSTTAQRDAAEEAAHRVRNVARVVNNLRVR